MSNQPEGETYRCPGCWEALTHECEGKECPGCGEVVRNIGRMGYEKDNRYFIDCEECGHTFKSRTKLLNAVALVFHHWRSHFDQAREVYLP